MSTGCDSEGDPVEVKAIRWIGVRTDRYDELRAFAVDLLGLRVVGESGDFAETAAANGDRFEIFGPGSGHPDWQFARNTVVVGFLVDDLAAAPDELASVDGVELLGEVERTENGMAWQHFRGPDGHVYELTYDPSV